MAGEGGAAALKGLRLLTMDRGPEGYGFHMYTNKELMVGTHKLSYIASVIRASKQVCWHCFVDKTLQQPMYIGNLLD